MIISFTIELICMKKLVQINLIDDIIKIKAKKKELLIIVFILSSVLIIFMYSTIAFLDLMGIL